MAQCQRLTKYDGRARQWRCIASSQRCYSVATTGNPPPSHFWPNTVASAWQVTTGCTENSSIALACKTSQVWMSWRDIMPTPSNYAASGFTNLCWFKRQKWWKARKDPPPEPASQMKWHLFGGAFWRRGAALTQFPRSDSPSPSVGHLSPWLFPVPPDTLFKPWRVFAVTCAVAASHRSPRSVQGPNTLTSSRSNLFNLFGKELLFSIYNTSSKRKKYIYL